MRLNGFTAAYGIFCGIWICALVALAGCAGGGSTGDALRAGTITATDMSTINYTVNVTISGGGPGGMGGTASPNTSVPITIPVGPGAGLGSLPLPSLPGGL